MDSIFSAAALGLRLAMKRGMGILVRLFFKLLTRMGLSLSLLSSAITSSGVINVGNPRIIYLMVSPLLDQEYEPESGFQSENFELLGKNRGSQ